LNTSGDPTEDQLTTLLFARSWFGYGVTALAVACLALQSVGRFPLSSLVGWSALAFLVLLGRFILARRFEQKRREEESSDRWRRHFALGTLCMALTWSVGLILFFAPDDTLQSAFLIAVVAGLAAGSSHSLNPVPKIAYTYIAAVVGTLALQFLFLAQLDGVLIGLLVLLFGVYFLFHTRRDHRLLREGIALNAEKTRILREMEDAKTRAERAEQARADLMATLSHELRTPANGILGLTQVLARSPLDEDQQSHLRSIHDSTELLVHLLNEVLDCARLEAGRLELEHLPFALEEVVEQCAAVARALAEQKGLRFSLSKPPTPLPQLVGDPIRLRQILLNLLTNAVKFTPSGSVELRVASDQPESNPGLWRFSVVDTGIGMDSETRSRIFQRFVQAECSTPRQFGGSGLGLAIARDLIELMKGELTVHSEPGQGSEFHLSLPLPRVEAAAAESDPKPKDPGELEGKVLLIEDNPVNQRVSRLLLAQTAFVVDAAANAEEALARLREGGFVLVLMDCQLPGITGVELARRIRRGEFPALDPRVPIIATTANATAQAERECREAGMNAFLTKPLRRPHLLATITRLLHPRA
jgi:two-component system, sensor histidine kinase